MNTLASLAAVAMLAAPAVAESTVAAAGTTPTASPTQAEVGLPEEEPMQVAICILLSCFPD
jgi:hypothetical protein